MLLFPLALPGENNSNNFTRCNGLYHKSGICRIYAAFHFTTIRKAYTFNKKKATAYIRLFCLFLKNKLTPFISSCNR